MESNCVKLHDDGGNVHVGLDLLVRENASAVDIDLVPNRHVIPEDGDVFKASPLPHGAVPTNDCALDPGVILDL